MSIFFGRKKKDAPKKRIRNKSPKIESLESRLVLGAVQNAAFADLTTGLAISQIEEQVVTSNLESTDSMIDVSDDIIDDSEYTPPADTYNNTESNTAQSPADATTEILTSALGHSLEVQVLPSTEVDLTRQDPSMPQIEDATSSIATGSQSVVGDTDEVSTGSTENTAVDSLTDEQSNSNWDAEALAKLGLNFDDDGNLIGTIDSSNANGTGFDAWWGNSEGPVTIKYDFRNEGDTENVITEEQMLIAEQSLQAWSEATDGQIVFERDTEAGDRQIINIGVGNVEVFGDKTQQGGTLGLGGGEVVINEHGQLEASGLAWLDVSENWDNTIGNGDVEGTVDFATVISHEVGHAIGFGDKAGSKSTDMMYGGYNGERQLSAIEEAVRTGYFYRTVQDGDSGTGSYELMNMTAAQLTAAEVQTLLQLGSVATASNDAIIAIVDRHGRILGVRVEQGVLDTISDTDTLVFAIDGAVAKARTAALFSNGDPTNIDAQSPNGTFAPLTSRLVRFVSQSTVTQREVESNPNVDGTDLATALASTTRGPGFVAPIGVGAHFPPDIPFTPQVDLFAIEHTNRDGNTAPGADGILGTADDIALETGVGADGIAGTFDDTGRFNIDQSFVSAGQDLFAPESYGTAQNSGLVPDAQSRGIATLPGGIPLFRDTNGDGDGDTLVGGVGVFFPGPDGFATHEQGFVAGIGQTTEERLNAIKVLESEFIATVVAGGSKSAQDDFGITENVPGIGDLGAALDAFDPGLNIDIPFGRLDLVGIQLQALGPIAGSGGVRQILQLADDFGAGTGADSGADQPLIGGVGGLYRDGIEVPTGWLVNPHDGVDADGDGNPDITADEVRQIILNGVAAANEVRAAVRLDASGLVNGLPSSPGSRTRMVLSVTDVDGNVLGLFRMQDATTFSIDVAVAKARNVSYWADAGAIDPLDNTDPITGDQIAPPGTAFTNRTFRFLSQPRFPSGIDGTTPAPFSILNDGAINDLTGENEGTPDTVAEFTSVLARDAFFPMTNFRDTGNLENQNGIVFFPGSMPLYKNGQLIGGLGVSGDGVDQDDVVTCFAALGFMPQENNVLRADEVFVRDIRLPMQHFLRNPFG